MLLHEPVLERSRYLVFTNLLFATLDPFYFYFSETWPVPRILSHNRGPHTALSLAGSPALHSGSWVASRLPDASLAKGRRPAALPGQTFTHAGKKRDRFQVPGHQTGLVSSARGPRRNGSVTLHPL